MVEYWVNLAVLMACAGYGFLLTAQRPQNPLERVTFSRLLLLVYTVCQPVSGIAHMLSPRTENHGFYDVMAGPPHQLTLAVIATVVAFVSLAAGAKRARKGKANYVPATNLRWLHGSERALVGLVVAVLFPLAWLGYAQVRAYAADAGLDRIVVVDDGFARYAYMSQWLVWVISLAVVVVAGGRKPLSQAMTLMITATAVLLIALVLGWTGGRSIAIVLAIPIIFLMLPRFDRFKIYAAVFGGGAAIIYASIISQTRIEGSRFGGSVSYFTWLDWESGRFSMTGFALDEVQKRGLLLGETFLNAVTWTLSGVVKLVGLSIPDLSLRSSSQVAGQALLRSDDVYIVPGFSAEVVLNFGVLGLIPMYYLLGWTVGKLDRAIGASSSLLGRLSLNFLGSVLVFRTIQADSSALPSFILYIGAPLFGAQLLNLLWRKLKLEDVASSRHMTGQRSLSTRRES